MLKAIIFDAYGTLFDTGTGSVDAAAEILAKCGRNDIAPKGFYARWKQLHRIHIDELTDFVCEEEIFHRDLRKLYSEYAIDSDADMDVEIMLSRQGTRMPYPETKAVIESLSGRYMLFTGSTTDTAPLLKDIRRAGLRFEQVFTSQSLKVYKPIPDFYKKILRQTGLEAGEVLFVGDSLVDDVKGPHTVGIKACWVNRKNGTTGEEKPEFTISDLSELPDIADSIP